MNRITVVRVEQTGCQLKRPTVKSERRRDTVGMEWKNEKRKIPNWSNSEVYDVITYK